MTEKRFWLISIDYDGEQRFVKDNKLVGEKSMSNQEVVNKLNVLSEENEQLKPFLNIAKDYNLTLDQLYNLLQSTLEGELE